MTHPTARSRRVGARIGISHGTPGPWVGPPLAVTQQHHSHASSEKTPTTSTMRRAGGSSGRKEGRGCDSSRRSWRVDRSHFVAGRSIAAHRSLGPWSVVTLIVGSLFCGSSSTALPRIKQRDTRAGKIRFVARHQREAVNQGRCGDVAVADSAWIGDVKVGTAQRDCGVDREDTVRKARKNVSVEPGAKQGALYRQVRGTVWATATALATQATRYPGAAETPSTRH